MDFDRIKLLFDVITACAQHGPRFKKIETEAQAELLVINEGSPAPAEEEVVEDE